jgi:hypothetical protein
MVPLVLFGTVMSHLFGADGGMTLVPLEGIGWFV